MRPLPASLVCCALAAAGAAFAQEPAEGPPAQPPASTTTPEPSAAPASDDATPALETAREAVRATTVWLARGVDSWFGDRPFEDGGRVSDGVLSIGLFKRESERPDVNVRLHARLRLPNLHESGFAFLGRDDPREVVADTPGAVARWERLPRDTRNDREFLAGIGVALRDALDVRLGLRGGFKPYLQVRYHDEWRPREANLVEFRQTFFLNKEDQLGSTTALSFAHADSAQLTLRWLAAATITQRARRYDTTSVIGAYRAFGDRRLLSLELLTNSLEGTGVTIDDAGVLLKWEQPFLRDWLVGEMTIGSFWPRPDPTVPRTHLWAAGLGVRISF
ncbi:MAG: hypothetical protein IPM15_01325 [Betaproteobacteria bacterium]|nr:hypothetical protein [Betaproteobacteria bacterium]